jgi:hypothetical protein
LDKRTSSDDDAGHMSVQEQFARLELQRLEQESGIAGDPSSALIEEDNLHEEDADEQNTPRPSIDPSTTSIILFPGQGTQFVGMG